MSGRAMGWVLKHGPTREQYGDKARGLRLVLLTIADEAREDGTNSHPGLAAMAERSLYSRAQVAKIVKTLEADGWVEVTQRGGGRGLATVFCIPGVTETVSPRVDSKANGNRLPQSGQNGRPETVHFGTETVSPRAKTVSPGVDPYGVTTVYTTDDEPLSPEQSKAMLAEYRRIAKEGRVGPECSAVTA